MVKVLNERNKRVK